MAFDASQSISWCPEKDFNADRFLKYLKTSLDSRQLTNGGPLQAMLATRLCTLTKSERCILPAASGTAALHALCAGWALKLERRLVWATQAFTFPPSMQGPLIDSIIVDIDGRHGGPSFSLLAKIVDRIDGVIVTNVFGTLTRVLEYEQWCRVHDKILVFDNAATPVGKCVDGRSIQDAGNGAIISLHETKPIGRGEGGAIFVDVDMREFVERAMNYGFERADRFGGRIGNRLCSNWRMSDFAAAAILDHLDTVLESNWLTKYADIVKVAVSVLGSRGFSVEHGLSEPTIPPCLFVRFPCTFEGSAESVVEMLNAPPYCIAAKHYYRPLVGNDQAPVAWTTYNATICLPFHLDLCTADINNMVKSLASAVECVSKIECPVKK